MPDLVRENRLCSVDEEERGLARWLGGGGADGPQHGLELVVPAPAAGLQLLLEGPGLEAPQDLRVGAFQLPCIAKEKRSAADAVADHEAALKDSKAAHDRCQALEDELQGLRDKHAEEARCREAKEEEVKAREDAVKNHDAELAELEKTEAAERSQLEGRS